jgi:hypothetical protein
VIYNIGPRSVYSALHFEHALCKIYQVAKMQLPNNNQSKQSSSANNFTHPLLVGKLARDPFAMPWGQHCLFVVMAMKEIDKSYRHLLKNKRIHLPSVVARIHGRNDTIPGHYHPSSTFGKQLERSAVMACLLGNRNLLIADQKKKGLKRPRD